MILSFTDWNELFTTKCFSCGFPIEAGDRWVEALNNNYHSQCFSCTVSKQKLPQSLTDTSDLYITEVPTLTKAIHKVTLTTSILTS